MSGRDDHPLYILANREFQSAILRISVYISFLVSIGVFGTLLLEKQNPSFGPEQQLAAETIALYALIASAFGTVSTFIFNWRTDKRNNRDRALEVENAVLSTKLKYEQEMNRRAQETIGSLMSGIEYYKPLPDSGEVKALPPKKNSK